MENITGCGSVNQDNCQQPNCPFHVCSAFQTITYPCMEEGAAAVSCSRLSLLGVVPTGTSSFFAWTKQRNSTGSKTEQGCLKVCWVCVSVRACRGSRCAVRPRCRQPAEPTAS